MPEYIQDIVFYGLEETSSYLYPHVPFVLVCFNGSSCLFYIGFNLALGYTADNGWLRIWSAPQQSTNKYACCYYSTYKLNDKGNFVPSTDWVVRPGSLYGNADPQRLRYYSGDLSTTTGYDFYLYGGNMIKALEDGLYTSVNIAYSNNNVGNTLFLQSRNGFSDGLYFSSAVQMNSYWNHFTPERFSLPNGSWIQDYKDSEDFLLSGYDINNFDDDFKVTLDDYSTSFIFNLLTTTVFSNSFVSIAFLSILCLGIVALLFNR